jgi:hypothetical protein
MRKIAVLMVLLAGCGGGGSVSLDRYTDEYRAAYCQYLTRCGLAESEDTCEQLHVDRRFPVAATVRAGVAMGKIVYDGGAARACIDAYAGRPCDVTGRDNRAHTDVCVEAFAGTLGDGAACGSSIECISRNCEAPACGEACCMGACVGGAEPDLGGPGDPCNELIPCGGESFCDRQSLMCEPLKPSGAACVNPGDCQYGLGCSLDKKCAVEPALGAPCSGGCRDDGTVCSPASGTCVKVGLAGAACANSEDCSLLYYCDASRRCARGAALGELCSSTVRCGDDRAFCDTPLGEPEGVCALPKADGSPCNREAGCESHTCDPFTLTCAPEPVCL